MRDPPAKDGRSADAQPSARMNIAVRRKHILFVYVSAYIRTYRGTCIDYGWRPIAETGHREGKIRTQVRSNSEIAAAQDPSELAGYACKVLRMLEVAGPTDVARVATIHGEPILDYLLSVGAARLSLDGSLLEITGAGIRQVRAGSRSF